MCRTWVVCFLAGRLLFSGTGAEAFLDGLVTRRTTGMTPGQVRYALITNDTGGILDDVLVYRLPDKSSGGQPAIGEGASHLMVVNASNRPKIVSWIEAKRCDIADVEMRDATSELAMIAVQGPRTLEVFAPLVRGEIGSLKYYHSQFAEVDNNPAIISRTGYTGEDGFEVMLPAAAATAFWQRVLDAGQAIGARACGLGCRDTLRLEAAMPLYGHELNEEITPFQAGLDFAVDLEGRTFPGREVLCKMQAAPPERVRVGLELSGKRVPREHYPVVAGGKVVGEITSGTFSPTLDRPIAMAYVDRDYASVGADLAVEVRGSAEPARVVKLPFYRRPQKKGSNH
jgi:aminomethyltransferase